ncbi:YlzJ-like family protein [Cohnella sp. WQ 127256]|uniref:YlzJ-like family protein n=1 Tax=Cohnella sp. WQ 127256 TaxID=2938790 RepID=UPI00211736E1|nr:YlzJ-like family protein [Cohnella sp. WQ 127256]
MTIYTSMPIELVLDGIQQEPGPFVDVTVQGMTMQLIPVAPGIGRIVRLLAAPLDCYLLSQYAPGQMVCYSPTAEPNQVSESPNFGI